MPDKPVKRLSYRDCRFIEDEIRMQSNFSFIARQLGVARSTVIREVQRNRTRESTSILMQTTRNVCLEAYVCRTVDLCKKGCLQPCRTCRQGLCNRLCPDFKENECPRLSKPPYVCNVCSERYGGGCEYGYRFYDAKLADEIANTNKRITRRGIDCSEEELIEMVKVVKPLVKKGQSLEHIWTSHGDKFPCSVRTFYRYINDGALEVINLDLPKKVAYKVRKKSIDPPIPRANLKGRTYADFEQLSLELQYSAVEMDCVCGKRGGQQNHSHSSLSTLLLPANDALAGAVASCRRSCAQLSRIALRRRVSKPFWNHSDR